MLDLLNSSTGHNMGIDMAKLKLLYTQVLNGARIKELRIYEDPFSNKELCVELALVDGQVLCIGVGATRPQVISSSLCRENAQQDCFQTR